MIDILKNVTGLAFEMFANGIQGGKADRLGFSGFENGQILFSDADQPGKLIGFHFALRQDHIQVYNYRHSDTSQTVSLFSSDKILPSSMTQAMTRAIPPTKSIEISDELNPISITRLPGGFPAENKILLTDS
jgi:hypothetical protein